jgi:hypothetical protein
MYNQVRLYAKRRKIKVVHDPRATVMSRRSSAPQTVTADRTPRASAVFAITVKRNILNDTTVFINWLSN